MIVSFTGKHRFLSNFYYIPIEYEGIKYPTSEHAYQAAKTLDKNERLRISKIKTPGRAKRAGQGLELRKNWENIKISVMEDILNIKFRNPELREMLLETKGPIVELNDWGDVFWGQVQRTSGELYGDNYLGRILMRIRGYYEHKKTIPVGTP